MIPTKPYQRMIRKSLFITTILPAFLIILIGFATFLGVYRILEINSLKHNIVESKDIVTSLNQKVTKAINNDKHKFESLNPKNDLDKTEIRRLINDSIHIKDASMIYILENHDIKMTNNYEDKNLSNLLRIKSQTIKFNNGYYKLSIYIEEQPYLNQLHYKNNQHLLLVDSYDNVLYSNYEKIPSNYKVTLSKFGYVYKSEYLPELNAHIVLLKDIHEILNDGIKLLSIMLLTFVILTIFGYISSSKISQVQTRDIESIIKRIKYAKERKLGTYEPLSRTSELEEINKYVYDLFESNEALIHSIEDTEKSLREIQLKEIERQFHPHFLFNTMQTIQYLVSTSPNKAEEILQQLSEMLRYSLRVKSDNVLVKDELLYIKKYISIQNVRFDDKIKLLIDVPSDIKEMKIDKMCIFPFIENAIKHNEREHDLTINIRIRENAHHLLIIVKDDGDGMSKEQLRLTRENLNLSVYETTHLGLNHLNHKLILKYGIKSKIKIYSIENKGTMIALRIPKGR
ncbi:histidine kinase [Mammaliicoccus sciuri]|uniref:sensor histidine kinase n=1 Tax=Mammaliicoccus sciuri TaxID=1296 RepID=UPI0013308F0E|nr:histidine kinase [Mammaliicoccus sciuri]MCJ1749174.1 histidine kinase [Mammaliicoccus sciuri]